MRELSRDAQALLELARRDRPRTGDRERVAGGLSGLGVGIASVAAGTSATAAAGTSTGTAAIATAGSTATGLTALGAKIVVPGLIGLAIGGTLMAPLALQEPERPAPAVPSSLPSPDRAATANARAVAPRVTAVAPSTTDWAPAAPTRSSVVPSVAERGSAQSSAQPKRAETLQAEAELLAAASGALGRGRAQHALELLDKHEREYADGVLAEERAAARVLALCETGRIDEARRHAEQFLHRAPRSPLVPRVRGSCAFAPAKAAADQATETPAAGHTGGEQNR
jgi:hypothetical protein